MKNMVAALVFVLVCPLITSAQQPPANQLPPEGKQKIEAILFAADNFRKEALISPRNAFDKYTAQGQASGYGLAGKLFLDEAPDKVWRNFFKGALLSASFNGMETAVVACYNPWCDIFLLSEWRSEGDAPGIVQMQFFHGDVIRKKGKTPYDLMPVWARSKMPVYASAALETAKSIKAFETVFPSGPATEKIVAWDKALGVNSEKLANANDAAVLGAFTRWVLAAQNFFDAPRFGAVRAKLLWAQELVVQGQADALLGEAAETLPETVAMLKSGEGLAFVRGAKLQTIAWSDHHCFVILTNPSAPNQYISFWFDGGLEKPRLRRVDFPDILLAYQKLPELLKATKGLD